MSLIKFLSQKISSLFVSDNPKITKEMFASTNEAIKTQQSVKKLEDRSLIEIAENEITKYPYFKKDKNDLLMAYIINNVQIKETNILTVDEKKKLNINSRYKVSQEILDFFDISAVEKEIFLTKNPKDFFSDLYNRVHFLNYKIRDIKNFKKVGIDKVKYVLIGGRNKPCSWCKSQENKVFKIDSILNLIEKNCSCDYNNVSLSPVMQNR